MRGSIVDIVPAGKEYGLRIDFFDDEIEQIKRYDPLTQLSSAVQQDSLQLLPTSELLLSEAAIDSFKQQYRAEFGGKMAEDPLYEALSAGRKYAGMEHWQGMCYALGSFTDYVPDAEWLLLPLAKEAAAERIDAVQDAYTARCEVTDGSYKPAPPALLYDLSPKWAENAAPATAVNVYNAAPDLFHQSKLGKKHSFELLQQQLEKQKHTYNLLLCSSEGARARVQQMLEEYAINIVLVDELNDRKALRRKGGKLGLLVLPAESGFEGKEWWTITEQDLLGSTMRAKAHARKKPFEKLMQEAMNLTPGELVVHANHGIGKFVDLITMEVLGAVHDMVQLHYAGGDVLYVPVENVDLIKRYGEETEGVQLDTLGGVAWQARHAAIKERIKMAAEELLAVAAKRATRTAESYEPADGLYDAFCARFPYNETEDQLRAIVDVEGDLASNQPMDRLICGDVGFGKTEIAIRAAHIVSCPQAAVLEGERLDADKAGQVAIVAPTTLLARQHFLNLQERFAGTDIIIKQLSRLVTPKQAKEVKEGLQNGSVDIVVGTHALLSDDVRFKRLGLVVVDEEQRFGVKQKERLKRWRANVHMLTLSATPIPRTLQLSLTGIRELSLIATPPVDRLAVRTQLLPFDGHIIREALLREHYRGGRTYYVCPRVKDLEEVEDTLAKLVPELKTVTAHGGMAPKQLEQVMMDFDDGKFDVLIATTIIESGLDIAAANTLIVHRADHYGLAQLYQIRGRVGRSKLRAYAYLTLPPRKIPSKQALKRLEVMQKLDQLGAGFTLASHDMDMRGFGNLLGEEQSGNIKEVGVELYQHMLKEAIANIQLQGDEGEEGKERFSPQIKLGISVLIPESYVQDIGLRMSLYRRIAALEEQAAIDAMAVELTDRFGPVPKEVQHLLQIVQLKHLCVQANIAKAELGKKGAVITFHNHQCLQPETLITMAASQPDAIILRPDHTIFMPFAPAADATGRITQLQKKLQWVAGLGKS